MEKVTFDDKLIVKRSMWESFKKKGTSVDPSVQKYSSTINIRDDFILNIE